MVVDGYLALLLCSLSDDNPHRSDMFHLVSIWELWGIRTFPMVLLLPVQLGVYIVTILLCLLKDEESVWICKKA